MLVGSTLQFASLSLFVSFDSLTSLYVISGLFGLFQGGIVPSYAIIVREYSRRAARARRWALCWRRPSSAWRLAVG